MKVFALMCAAAIAVSTPMVDADDIVCTTKTCASTTALALAKGVTQKFTAPTCTVSTEKAYVTSIDFEGATADKLVVATVGADGIAITETVCTQVVEDAAATFKATGTPNCGKTGNKGAQISLTCDSSSPNACSVSYTITYACLTPDDVAVDCKATPCPTTDLAIPNSKKATFKPLACTNTSEFAYLSAITLTGVSTDKLTYVVNYKNATAIEGCAGATPASTVTAGATTALTCGKGDGGDVSVDVACGSTSTGDCTVGGTVTFACAAPTATTTAVTPTPSMGSMLTKANAIVGLISGMVGAVVYFNRG